MTGPSYYPECLANIGEIRSRPDANRLSVGDRVSVCLDAEVLKAMSEGHGGWVDDMEQVSNIWLSVIENNSKQQQTRRQQLKHEARIDRKPVAFKSHITCCKFPATSTRHVRPKIVMMSRTHRFESCMLPTRLRSVNQTLDLRSIKLFRIA